MIQMATRSERLRGATMRELISEAERALKTNEAANKELSRSLRGAMIRVRRGADPITPDTEAAVAKLMQGSGMISDIVCALSANQAARSGGVPLLADPATKR